MYEEMDLPANVSRMPQGDWRDGVRAYPEAALVLSFGFGLLASALFRPTVDDHGNYVKDEQDSTWQTLRTALLAILAREAKRWVAGYKGRPGDRYVS